jgi:hypothetical protein
MGLPIKPESRHSYTIKLTTLLLSPGMSWTRMKGSTAPPQEALLYMPEHLWLFSSR